MRLDFLKEKLDPHTTEVRFDEPLSGRSTFGIGGNAAAFVIPGTPAALVQAVAVCREENTPYFLLGRGSNVLFGDGFIEKVVISASRLDNIAVSEKNADNLTAGAGALLKNIADFAQRHGLAGFEFAGGIPGTLGGAACMNAGAYGSEIKDIFVNALVLEEDGYVRRVYNEEMGFSYRQSAVMERNLTVIEAEISLRPGNGEEIREKMREYMEQRNSKQPADMPSAGSVFKRPADGVFAAALIEECGLKGFCIGGAEVSRKHSGFIVNTGGALASDVLAVIDHVRGVVLEKKGYLLEPEIIFCM